MGKYNPKKISKRNGTKRRKKGVDEVHEDLHRSQNMLKIRTRAPDLDLPALGEFYCVACAKYFVSNDVMEKHTQTKPHKRRVKRLNSEVPYGLDLKDVYGMKVDNGTSGDNLMAQEKPNPQLSAGSVISVRAFDPQQLASSV